MTRPGAARLFAAMELTWPAAATRRLGPVTLREGQGGGNRVSAATVEGAFTAGDIEAAEQAMRDLGQTPCWMIRSGAEALDAALEARGYRVHEPVWLYLCPVATFAHEPPRVSAFVIWPPLAIQRDLWAEGHIGPARIAIMERAAQPRTTLLGRTSDRPAGAAFVGIADGIAFLHALHVPEEMRRKGVARNLMCKAAVWAQENGADWFALAVTRANQPGNGLYASLGMEIVEQYHYRLMDEVR